MARQSRIRRIDIDDLETIRRLALDIWPKCYRNVIGPDRVDAVLASLYALENLEREMREEGQVFWVVRVGAIDVGYASACTEGGRLWLKKLYVRDDHRGLGLGRQLIDAALKHFNATEVHRDLALNVNKDNGPAIDYYLRSGFRVEAEVPVVMGPYGFTDYVMHKAL